MSTATASSYPKPPLVGTFSERLRVWWHNFKCRKTARAYRNLAKALKDDPGYFQAWHANVSMTIYDATRPKCFCLRKPGEEHFNPLCEQRQDETIPLRFGLKEMSIEQSDFIANRLMKHMFSQSN